MNKLTGCLHLPQNMESFIIAHLLKHQARAFLASSRPFKRYISRRYIASNYSTNSPKSDNGKYSLHDRGLLLEKETKNVGNVYASKYLNKNHIFHRSFTKENIHHSPNKNEISCKSYRFLTGSDASRSPPSSSDDYYKVLESQRDIFDGLEEMYISNKENTGWVIRLANENGYLSWCRNTYICTMIGVTVAIQNTPIGEAVGIMFFIGGLLQMTWGTSTFIYNNFALQDKILARKPMVLLQCGLALLHFALWFLTVYMFLYGADELEELQNERQRDDS